MITKTQQIRIEEFNYPLPDERIAKFPLAQRDSSRLLIYRDKQITEERFSNLPAYLPEEALVVFNNTRVICARLYFRKVSGARIEIFCLEPTRPHDYALILQETRQCTWACLVGNLKKWKEGKLAKTIAIDGTAITLWAEKNSSSGDNHQITFSWDNEAYTFGDLLEAAGILPIPPYLHRETEESDLQNYQTVYSKIKGSVAAPTAGLHFTPDILNQLDSKGFRREEVTLHVGAGTFKPVKSETIEEHEMHTEYISVNYHTIEQLLAANGNVVAVGTTSVRTLESLYYIGVTLANKPDATPEELVVDQWMPYQAANNLISLETALNNILDYLDRNQTNKLLTATRIMIAPGYQFHLVRGIITNFHQPKSTLLLLVSAFADGNWKAIYEYALANNFRFLSYGDSSLLIRPLDTAKK
ncbi:MAG: S-adenosylmethionine:tRNA ribosyltransferase-isomerase [Tannerellaceae bacterium]|nr:S-adenosylmethionine:tRNA ribosyltransferase-isomerase [Tannerellaceae bacterium]